MQSRMMLQIKLWIRPSKIQKLSAICNYGGNCYFKVFSFFQRNSMLLAEILRILNHRKSFCSWWRLNIMGNQNNVLSTYFSWLKKSTFWNIFKKTFHCVVLANYSILFTHQNISIIYFKAKGGGFLKFYVRILHPRSLLWYFSSCNYSFNCESGFSEVLVNICK